MIVKVGFGDYAVRDRARRREPADRGRDIAGAKAQQPVEVGVDSAENRDSAARSLSNDSQAGDSQTNDSQAGNGQSGGGPSGDSPSGNFSWRRGQRRWWQWPMGVWALLAMVLGAGLGHFAPGFAQQLKPLGEVFVHLVQMIVVPLVFPLIVLGISQLGSVRRLGSLAWRTILYFEVVTTIILLLAVGLAELFDIGAGVPVRGGNLGQLPNSGRPGDVNFGDLLLHAVPENVFQAFAEGNLLAVLVFAVLFGIGMTAAGEKALPVRRFLDGLSEIMFGVVRVVIRLAPLGILGYLAYDVGHYGLGGVRGLLGFLAIVYLGLALIMLVLFPVIATIFRVRYLALVRAVAGLAGIAFVTRSSEAVLAPLLARLEEHGVRRSTSSFVVPLGYSFNTDGSTLYQAVALVFVANAYGMHLTPTTLLTMVLVLVVLSKGVAGVASAAIVVLMAAGQTLGLPAEGIALLMGVDFLADMARTAVNVFGNSLAAVVLDGRGKTQQHADSELDESELVQAGATQVPAATETGALPEGER